MRPRILNSFIAFSAAVLVSVIIAGCSKLKAGDTFTVTTDGVEFQYEVIVSRMNFVRVVPVSGRLSGSITIPPTVSYDGNNYVVTQVGQNAFRDGSTITAISLPKTLSIIEASAFQGCTMLETINTPQPLSEIGDFAFDGCSALKEFSLDASISKLGKGCFRGCTSLKTMKFPSSFTEIPDEAFCGCSSLDEIRCPATVMQIGKDAFSGCVGVKEIYLDRSVGNIGARAFAGCSSVETMTCLTATPPACSSNTFDGILSEIPVTVMISALENYRAASGWNHFTNFKGTY